MSCRKTLDAYIAALLCVPYRWGGDNPVSGLDCSGLVVELLTAAGALPHGTDLTAQSLYNRFKTNKKIDPTWGCLAFFGRSIFEITHVGFCLGDGLMVEAGGGGSRTLTKADAEKQGAWIRIRPIRYRSDFLLTCSAISGE